MQMTTMLLKELTAEVDRSRRALELVPDGQHDFKPHERSMVFGSIAMMVATIFSWVAMIVTQDELDLTPATPQHRPAPMNTSAEYIKALDGAAAAARKALEGTSDEHLLTPWKLKAGGQVVQEAPRHEMIRDTFLHLAHHRGQMTVYLRLMGAKVPALYGPSADDNRF